MNSQLPSPRIEQVREYILSKWDETVRSTPRDEGTLLALPFPYTVPSRKDTFQELYYWDTYFTSLGLLIQDRKELAIGNTRNLMSMVDRFGFVPNGNRTFYLNRSQFPYLGPLIALVSSQTKDRAFSTSAAPILEREYLFYTTRRRSPCALSRCGNQATREGLIEFYPVVAPRVGLTDRLPEDCLEELSHTMAEAETGWDFTPRFSDAAEHFCPIDLNSNLYLYERLLAAWSEAPLRSGWSGKAEQRRRLVNELCWNEDRGGFFDYNFVEKKQASLVSAAALQPLWAGLADERQARLTVQKILPHLEMAHGISACALSTEPHRICQWDYPNAWPPLQHIAYRGLHRYGFVEEARRIAGKHIETVCRGFEETGDLWEKYSAVDGSTRTTNEAGYIASTVADRTEIEGIEYAPSMMGWTAGVFLDAVDFLEDPEDFWLSDAPYQP